MPFIGSSSSEEHVPRGNRLRHSMSQHACCVCAVCLKPDFFSSCFLFLLLLPTPHTRTIHIPSFFFWRWLASSNPSSFDSRTLYSRIFIPLRVPAHLWLVCTDLSGHPPLLKCHNVWLASNCCLDRKRTIRWFLSSPARESHSVSKRAARLLVYVFVLRPIFRISPAAQAAIVSLRAETL